MYVYYTMLRRWFWGNLQFILFIAGVKSVVESLDGSIMGFFHGPTREGNIR